MIRTSGLLSVLAAAIFFSAAPARGEEYYIPETDMPQIMHHGQKDECLLVAMNCTDSYKADTVDQRIDRLKKEIDKGTDVYSEYELKQLNKQLDRLNAEKGGDDSY